MILIKKIIPFEKELLFKTKVCEITSISLEHKINTVEDDLISGIFHISGDYKMTEGSINREKFSYDVDFDIALDSRYDTKNMVIDIDDFTYRIVNDEILKIKIDLFIDGELLKEEIIETKPETQIKEQNLEEVREEETKKDKEKVQNLEVLEPTRNNENTNINQTVENTNSKEVSKTKEFNIFDNIDDNETYATYYVYILKEEEIKQYQQTLNELKQEKKHILSLINKDILRLVFLLALSGWIIFASASIIISIIIILMSIVAAAPVSKDIIELNKTYKEFKADEKEIAANKEILENEMCSWHNQTLKMVEKIEKRLFIIKI